MPLMPNAMTGAPVTQHPPGQPGMPAGLLGKAMPQEAAPGGQDAGMRQEDIDKLKQAKQMAMAMIYDESILAELVKRYDAGDKTDTLAQTVVAILNRVNERMGGLPLSSLLGLALALIGEVAQLMADTGREAYTSDETERALYLAVQLWLQQNKDKVNPQELHAGMQDLQQMIGG